jgi:hypothetical protein
MLAIIAGPSVEDGSVIWHFKTGASLIRIIFFGIKLTVTVWFCVFLSWALGNSPNAGDIVIYLSSSVVSGLIASVIKLIGNKLDYGKY